MAHLFDVGRFTPMRSGFETQLWQVKINFLCPDNHDGWATRIQTLAWTFGWEFESLLPLYNYLFFSPNDSRGGYARNYSITT